MRQGLDVSKDDFLHKIQKTVKHKRRFLRVHKKFRKIVSTHTLTSANKSVITISERRKTITIGCPQGAHR